MDWDNFEMSGVDSVQVNLGQSGANQFWDFSNYNFTYKSNWRVLDYTKAPFKNRFPSANIVYEVTYIENDTITFNYARLSNRI